MKGTLVQYQITLFVIHQRLYKIFGTIYITGSGTGKLMILKLMNQMKLQVDVDYKRYIINNEFKTFIF